LKGLFGFWIPFILIISFFKKSLQANKTHQIALKYLILEFIFFKIPKVSRDKEDIGYRSEFKLDLKNTSLFWIKLKSYT